MSGASATSSARWTQRKFWQFTACAFIAQCVLLFILSDRSTVSKENQTASAFYRWVTTPVSENDILNGVLASDPTLFALPNANGLSGMAWLKTKDPEYAPPQWDEPPRWLGFDPDWLGRTVLAQARSSALPAVAIGEDRIPDELPLAVMPQKPSQMRVEGDLRERFMNVRKPLSAWARSELLGDSVVQLAINGAGDVVTCRLMPPGSGAKSADEEALAIARTAKFVPRNDIGATSLTWGTFVFEWQTVPLPETNNVAAAPEPAP